jgi:hypothetical protein
MKKKKDDGNDDDDDKCLPVCTVLALVYVFILYDR